MGKCDICGREQVKLHTIKNLHVCNKHYSQYQTYRKFLDNNPRTTNDLNEIIIDGNIAKIQLYNKKQDIIGEALIDAEDIPKVSQYKWRLTKKGTNRSKCGGILTGNGKETYTNSLHRHIMNCPDNMYVDHINGNRFDNRKCNLRICTNQENNFNTVKRAVNTSGYKGVWYDKTRNKWTSEIKYNNKKVFIGRYNDIKEAAFTRFYAELLLQKEYISNESKAIYQELQKQIQDEEKLMQVVNNKLKNKALI